MSKTGSGGMVLVAFGVVIVKVLVIGSSPTILAEPVDLPVEEIYENGNKFVSSERFAG